MQERIVRVQKLRDEMKRLDDESDEEQETRKAEAPRPDFVDMMNEAIKEGEREFFCFLALFPSGQSVSPGLFIQSRRSS